jgi:hypothetical protein
MRLTKLSVGISLLVATLVFSARSLRAQGTNDSSVAQAGTAPRSSADKYHAHAEHLGVSIGAELLTRKEVSKEFAADMNHCCIVVQVAVYPRKDEPVNISRDDFKLTVEGTDTPVRSQSAGVISAKLEKADDSTSVTTSTDAGIGYETGGYTDPVTGQPVRGHTVTRSADVGVGAGDPVRVPAAEAEFDRQRIERELNEKGLPEAKIAMPVSGYLYFPLRKQKKNAKYRLEYVVNGETLNLELP